MHNASGNSGLHDLLRYRVGRDEALRAPASGALIDTVLKAGLFQLDAGQSHPRAALDAGRTFGWMIVIALCHPLPNPYPANGKILS
jgi:hypothetical protein